MCSLLCDEERKRERDWEKGEKKNGERKIFFFLLLFFVTTFRFSYKSYLMAASKKLRSRAIWWTMNARTNVSKYIVCERENWTETEGRNLASYDRLKSFIRFFFFYLVRLWTKVTPLWKGGLWSESEMYIRALYEALTQSNDDAQRLIYSFPSRSPIGYVPTIGYAGFFRERIFETLTSIVSIAFSLWSSNRRIDNSILE